MALSLRENICRAGRLPRDEQVLMGRAALLEERDRALIEAIFVRGQRTRAVGRLMGLSTRQVRSRARRLARLLTSRAFLEAARALPYLPREDVSLARLRFCAGLSQRDLSERLGISQHAVRTRLERLAGQIATISRIQCARRGLSGRARTRDGLTRQVRETAGEALADAPCASDALWDARDGRRARRDRSVASSTGWRAG